MSWARVLIVLAVAAAVTLAGAGRADAAPGPIANPSLETDANGDGVPDCFTTAGFGTNTASFARVADPHSGSWAERTRITAYTDGDRKLVPTMAPGCAPSVVPGELDTISVWYHSSVPVMLVAYALRPSGWDYWLSGPERPTSAAYQQTSLDLPAIPADVTAVSFGLAVYTVGEVVTDDYLIAPKGAPPACSAGYVALTYDDGPGTGTPTLLDTLANRHAKATFFVVGDQIEPSREATVVRESRNGNVVANHTWTHARLTDLSNTQVRNELTQLNNRVVGLGVPKPNLMRPPYSATDTRVDGIAKSLGLTTTLFDVDSHDSDSDAGISVAETVSNVVNGARSGSIIIMHDLQANTIAAAPGVIDGLRGRGFCLGTIRPSAAYNIQNRSYVEIVP